MVRFQTDALQSGFTVLIESFVKTAVGSINFVAFFYHYLFKRADAVTGGGAESNFSLYNVILSLVHNFIRAVFPDRQRLQGVQSLFFPVAQKFQIFVVHYYITFSVAVNIYGKSCTDIIVVVGGIKGCVSVLELF